jgi:hypothetical protein
MKISSSQMIVSCLLAVGIVASGYFLFFQPGDRVDIRAEKNDLELSPGPVAVVQNGIYKSKHEGDSGAQFIAQYSTRYRNGNQRVVKTILSHGMPYQTLTGYYVLYEYFREDGSIEHDKLVEPEVTMGASVWEKYRLRFFDTNNKKIQERYVRADGSLGCLIDTVSGNITSYYSDGTTIREQQTTVKGTEDMSYTRTVRFRKDGKTIWWSSDYPYGRTRIHFDLYGNPINKEFTREYPGDGVLIMGSNEPAKLLSYDKYWRSDGTLEYEQTWYQMYDKKEDVFLEVIGAVSVFDSTGKKTLITYNLQLTEEGNPRYIKEVYVHNSDGTTLVRKYRSPNCRSSEALLNQAGVTVRSHQFSSDDHYQEKAEDSLFQGFDRDLWGNPDVNPHDI